MLYLNINLIKRSSGSDLGGFARRRDSRLARLSLPIDGSKRTVGGGLTCFIISYCFISFKWDSIVKDECEMIDEP